MPASSVLLCLLEFVQIHVHWVQFCSATQSYPTLCEPMDCSMPGFPIHHQLPELLKLKSIESVMPSNHLILCHPFCFCPQSFPEAESFLTSQFFASGGQNIGASASATVLWGWFHLGLTGLMSLLFKGLSRVFSSTIRKPQFFGAQPSLWSNSHLYMTTGKTIAWLYGPLSTMSLLFNTLSTSVKGFPGGSNGKESACSSGDPGLVLGSGRSPAGRHSNSLQYSCLIIKRLFPLLCLMRLLSKKVVLKAPTDSSSLFLFFPLWLKPPCQTRLAGYSLWGHKESDMTETTYHALTPGLSWLCSYKASCVGIEVCISHHDHVLQKIILLLIVFSYYLNKKKVALSLLNLGRKLALEV